MANITNNIKNQSINVISAIVSLFFQSSNVIKMYISEDHGCADNNGLQMGPFLFFFFFSLTTCQEIGDSEKRFLGMNQCVSSH